MKNNKYNEEHLEKIEHLLGYFDAQALASYRNEPQKYVIETSDFNGHLSNTEEYIYQLMDTDRLNQVVNIRFGYRTLEDNNIAIVVWLPDLVKSSSHIEKWNAFRLTAPIWTHEYDERFNNWVRRFIEGSWDVKNGPSVHLQHTISLINSLTSEVVGIPLFKHDLVIKFPAAENNHRYQDAHRELYGYLIDGLDKQCISQLATHLNQTINIASSKSVKAICMLFPQLSATSNFMSAVGLVSEQRRLATHSVRPIATDFLASTQFSQDLSLCLTAFKDLLSILESQLNVSSSQAHKRHSARDWLPKIDRSAETHYSIARASQMKGKTVEKVEFGFRKVYEDVHGSEAIIIYFTDGTIMGLQTATNIRNILGYSSEHSLEEFHVDFDITWLPSLTTEDKSET